MTTPAWNLIYEQKKLQVQTEEMELPDIIVDPCHHTLQPIVIHQKAWHHYQKKKEEISVKKRGLYLVVYTKANKISGSLNKSLCFHQT